MTDMEKDLTALSAQDETRLDVFFDAARTMPPPVSDDLMARVLAGSQTAQVQPVAPDPKPRGGWFASIGGWPSFAALSTAMLAGLWIGYSPPTGFEALTAGLSGTDDVTVEIFNVMASYDDLFAIEG